jgi:UDP:flavonoid glycosyltransferase YjiC (YdhE family)
MLLARHRVCAVAFGRDQLEVARRVEVAAAGTRLPAKRLNPDRLRSKVREAMTKAEGAKRVADAFETRLLGSSSNPQRLLGV